MITLQNKCHFYANKTNCAVFFSVVGVVVALVYTESPEVCKF